MHGGLLEVEGQTYQIFVEKICLKYVENYDCLEVDELTFWNMIFLKSFCWKYVENYACSLTWGGWKELDGVKRSNYRLTNNFLGQSTQR